VSGHCLLVLGGTRSGKSRYAEEAALRLGGERVTYVATARSGEPGLDARIAAHRLRRPRAWETIEAGLDLAAAVASAPAGRVLLVDSLTLWVASVLEADETGGAATHRWADAARAIGERDAPTVIVSDEVGLGLVPVSELGRRFRDELGTLNQAVAAFADEVVLVVAGLPLTLRARP
jgi:adenosylcobinamide kinase/adenosylcobinamide-phosphate guanylyltransferase